MVSQSTDVVVGTDFNQDLVFVVTQDLEVLRGHVSRPLIVVLVASAAIDMEGDDELARGTCSKLELGLEPGELALRSLALWRLVIVNQVVHRVKYQDGHFRVDVVPEEAAGHEVVLDLSVALERRVTRHLLEPITPESLVVGGGIGSVNCLVVAPRVIVSDLEENRSVREVLVDDAGCLSDNIHRLRGVSGVVDHVVTSHEQDIRFSPYVTEVLEHDVDKVDVRVAAVAAKRCGHIGDCTAARVTVRSSRDC